MSMSRRPSAYNVYVKENKDQFNSINDWAVSWKNLTEEEKQEYRVKAQNIETNQKCKEKCLKKRLRCVMKDMQNLGIDVAAIYKNLDGEVEVCGDGKIASVLLQDTNILTQVNSKQKETPSDVTTVRKKAQEHMNNLYSNAVGKKHQFPYGKVKRQELYVNGFLSDLLPIRPMSDYGMIRKVFDIVNCSEDGLTTSTALIDSSDIESTSFFFVYSPKVKKMNRRSEQSTDPVHLPPSPPQEQAPTQVQSPVPSTSLQPLPEPFVSVPQAPITLQLQPSPVLGHGGSSQIVLQNLRRLLLPRNDGLNSLSKPSEASHNVPSLLCSSGSATSAPTTLTNIFSSGEKRYQQDKNFDGYTIKKFKDL